MTINVSSAGHTRLLRTIFTLTINTIVQWTIATALCKNLLVQRQFISRVLAFTKQEADMEKTIEIQMKELLERIENEVGHMKRGDNDCCHDYERRMLDVLDYEKSKFK
jgi:hypothetical protein